MAKSMATRLTSLPCLTDRVSCRRSAFVRHKVSGSYISTRSPPIGGARQNAATLLCKLCTRSVKFNWSLLVISNRDRVPAAPVLRTFVQYLIEFCSRPERDSDVISGMCVRPIVDDKHAKFRDPGIIVLEKFHAKPSEAAFSTI